MARILVVDDDPDILLFLQVTLRGVGHEVATCSHARNAVDLLRQTRYDAVVLDVNMPEMSGFEVLKAIREAVGPAVPVLMLSAAADAADRVRSFQEGADDFLAKPWHPEELRLRIERLVAKAAPPAGELAGDLATYPLWDLLQSLERGEQSGVLELAVAESQATLLLSAGRLSAASLGALTGEEAVLAALSLKSGGFRFRQEEPALGWIEDEPMVSIGPLLMRHAWQADELEVRRSHLPSAFQPISWDESQALPAELETLPFQRLLAQLQGTARTLAELDGLGIAAPLTIRLMVARLVEAGVVVRVEGLPEPGRWSDPELEAAIERLVTATRSKSKVLHILLLAEPETWELLHALLAELPERDDEDRVRRRQLTAQRGGSLDLRHPGGQLALHLQVLSGATRRQAESVLPLCQSVVLWLHSVPGPEVAPLIARVEASTGVRSGLLIGDEDAARAVRPLLVGHRWRVLTQPPPSLAAVLGLLG